MADTLKRLTLEYLGGGVLERDVAEFDEELNQPSQAFGKRITAVRVAAHRDDYLTLEDNIISIDEGARLDIHIIEDNGRPFTTFEVYQIILLEQTKALLRQGFPQEYQGRVHSLWCLYLRNIGEAFVATSSHKTDLLNMRWRDTFRPTYGLMQELKEKNLKESEATAKVHMGLGEEEDDIPVKPGKTGSRSPYSATKFTMNTLICILYLAAAMTNPCVTLSDFLRMMKSGTIPYMNADKFLPTDIKLRYKDNTLFCYLVIPSHTFLRAHASNLARYLDLQNHFFPPGDIKFLCITYITRLHLPGELVRLVVGLLNAKQPLVQFTPFHKKLSASSLPQYEAVAASYIIYVLRNLFGCYGHIESYISTYASKVTELNIFERESKPFSLSRWMQWIISVQKSTFPDNLMDREHLTLDATVRHVEAVAPPASRHQNYGGIMHFRVNDADMKAGLLGALDDVADELKSGRRKQTKNSSRRRSAPMTPLSDKEEEDEKETDEEADDECDTESHTEEEMETEPLLDQEALDFSCQSLRYVIDYESFCLDLGLLEKFSPRRVRKHLAQYLRPVEVTKVTTALMRRARYVYLDKYQQELLPATHTINRLFQIFAEFLMIPIKELQTVYITIEEAIRYHAVGKRPSNISTQYMYFPRPPPNVPEKRKKTTQLID